MLDRYDSRGRLLDEPDDGPEWCARHDQDADTCPACLEEFRCEEAAYLTWRATQPAPSAGNLDDLPF